MAADALLTPELSQGQFNKISNLIKGLCGINLHNGKKQLVKARLSKRLRRLGLRSFEQYVNFIRSDHTGGEITQMLDAISTNLTGFFRERKHFDYLGGVIIPSIASDASKARRLRIWSAGCSSGEEAYSIAMTLRDSIDDMSAWDVRILATDISSQMLTRARKGVYESKRLETVPPQQRLSHFECIQTRPQRLYQVRDDIRRMVTLARLNLVDSWPMCGPFDVIFCRNVMIYFDKATQIGLINRFRDLLAPGGTLFIGHSESLSGVRNRFKYVQPTIYQKPSSTLVEIMEKAL